MSENKDLPRILSKIICSGTSKLMTKSILVCKLDSLFSSSCDCLTVLGNPSNNQPSGYGVTFNTLLKLTRPFNSSKTSLIIKSSGTKFPEATTCCISSPRAVLFSICLRKTSPLDIGSMLYFSFILLDKVP